MDPVGQKRKLEAWRYLASFTRLSRHTSVSHLVKYTFESHLVRYISESHHILANTYKGKCGDE